jgi:hypothetical protein
LFRTICSLFAFLILWFQNSFDYLARGADIQDVQAAYVLFRAWGKEAGFGGHESARLGSADRVTGGCARVAIQAGGQINGQLGRGRRI